MSIESRSRQYGKVFDHWQIKEFLGSGSGGKTAVFRLTRMDSTRGTSALKVVNLIEERGDINALSDFRRKEYEAAREQCSRSAEQEVWLMDDLRGNTNIVDYLDHTFVDWSDETGFGRDLLIRMELLKDLRSELRNGRMFSEREVLKIGRDICVALIRCHRKNILHRDVKPENIFRNKDGDYKLGDFGVSRVLDACPGAVASTGIGTYEYWPAEQMTGSYDKRVDVYSLGLVLYELSNQNRLPFAAFSYATGKEVSLRLSGTALPEPSEASPALARVILKACAFNPDERYQSAEEFLKALNRVIRSAQDVAKPNVPQAPAKQAKSHDDYATVLAKELGLPDSIFADDSYKTAPAKAGDVPFRTSPKAQSVRQIERSYRTKPTEQMPTLLGKRRKKEKHSLVVILSITALSLIVLGLGASLLLFGHKKVDPVDEQAGLAATTPSKANEANSEDEIKDNLQESLTIVLSEDDFKILDSYPHLKTLNLSGSTCYKTIQEYIANHPDVSVTYTVSLGNIEVENTETSISLIPDDFSYAVMLENLQYLPQLTSITFDNIELTGAEMATLRNAYPNLNVHYAVELFGQIIDLNATYLDLSSMNSTQVDEAAAKMGLLPKLNSVQLNSALSMNEVATLQNSNRAAEFRYTFQLFGQVLSTTDDEVIFKNQQIGNEGELQIRQAMEILDGCHRFVLDNCGIDSEILASIREDFRDGPKLVWRVYFGLDNRYNTLTDADTIRAVYNVTDDTCRSLKYCEEVKYMDIGHNDGLSDLSFVAEMPDLEILIASSSSVTELSGFENCKKLTWLELVSCTQLRNIDALSGCENLAYLNLCYTNVSDYSSLNDLPLKRFVCLEPKVSTEMQDSFTRNHADCRVVFQGYDNPWVPWRYDDNGKTFEAYYSNVVRKVFNYDELEKYMA